MADKGGYNPYENRHVAKPISDFGAFILLLKSVVGTGVLSLPLAFYFAGIINGVILLILVCIMLIHGIQLLIICMVECSRRMQIGYATFPQAMEYSFGQGPKCFRYCSKAGGYFCDGVLGFSQFGVCVVYTVFVSANFKQLIDFYFGVADIRIYVACIGLLLIGPFLIRKLKYLIPFNIVATILIYSGFFMMMYYVFLDMPSISERNIFFGPIELLPLFFGIAIFSITSVGVMLAIESEMSNPQHYIGWFGVLDWAILIVMISYIFFGIVGYWRYGDKIEDSISLNIPTDQVLAQVSKGFIAMAIFLSYPLAGYVVIDIIMNHYWNKSGELKHAFLKEELLRVGMVLLTTITGILVPNLGPLLSLVGALTISLLNLVFPALIEICLYYPPEYNYGRLKWKLVKDIMYVIIGLVILVQGTVFAILSMIKEWGGGRQGDTTGATDGTTTMDTTTVGNITTVLTTAIAEPTQEPAFRFL
ncbi:glutamate transporter polyphemus isoform X1 [Drosophila takahashii]|uniref:glutamate transporter polyphemus isoform X1 n=2 Tax=Drosophila takahashii TaxID=29030 RepID=UPI001CF90B77|nr:glutamate transporter polyphemus [Drosophila takahashii]